MPTKWTSRTMFPRDNYIICCTEEAFGKSSKENLMATLTFEIRSPEVQEIAGEQYTMAGINGIKHYQTTTVFKDDEVNAEKTEGARARYNELCAKFGLPAETNFDNPKLGFKGKLVHARLGQEEYVQRKAPTAEQAKAGQPGDILKNPVTGEELKNFKPKIEEIYGLAPGNVNVAF